MPRRFFSSIGEAAYEWRLDTDALIWSGNAAALLGVADRRHRQRPRLCAAGRCRRRAKPRATPSCRPRRATTAKAFPIRCNTRSGAATRKIWLEDTGRWFAGADGKPLRAHGMVRAINERHEREAELLQLAKFDPLTGEMNRLHLTEVLGATLDDAMRFRALLRFPAGRHRPSRPSQRSLRLRRRRGSDRAGRQAHPRAAARQGSSRPFLRQQVRRHPDQLHARRIVDRRRAAARRRARRNHSRPLPARWR